MGFPFFCFQSFSSAFFPLQPASPLFVCSTFLFSYLVLSHPLTPFFVFLFRLSLLPPSISVSSSSSGQMAGLRVTVCCLGGVTAYRAVGYISEDILPRRLCFPYILHLCLYTLPTLRSLCQMYTQTFSSPWPSCWVSAVYTYSMCMRLLTEWGFVERDGPQSRAGNRLESEPACPDSLISSLIHGLTAGSTRAHTFTDTHTQCQLQGPKGEGKVHTSTLELAQQQRVSRLKGALMI